MRIIGVDPGVTGGLALMVDGRVTAVEPMPVHDGVADGASIASLIERWNADVVVVEKTQAMPKNGSIASYSLGMNTGIVYGVVTALQHPLVKIRPIDWKRCNGLVGKTKDASRGLATELWPGFLNVFKIKRTGEGQAEAALIARAHHITYIRESNAS